MVEFFCQEQKLMHN